MLILTFNFDFDSKHTTYNIALKTNVLTRLQCFNAVSWKLQKGFHLWKTFQRLKVFLGIIPA